MIAGVVDDPLIIKYERLWIKGSSCSQTRWDAKRSAAAKSSLETATTSPRVASTSGVSTNVVATSVSAVSTSPSKVTMEEIVAFWLLGKIVTSSPFVNEPRRTVPETPRKFSARAII